MFAVGFADCKHPTIFFFSLLSRESGGDDHMDCGRCEGLANNKTVKLGGGLSLRDKGKVKKRISYPPNANVGIPWIFVRMRNNPPESGYFASCPESISFRAVVT